MNGDVLLAHGGYEEKRDLYRLNFETDAHLRFSKMINYSDSICPSVSLVWCDSAFFWTINEALLLDSEGLPFVAGANNEIPILYFIDGRWNCRIGDHVWVDMKARPLQSLVIEKVYGGCFIVVKLPTGSELAFPLMDCLVRLGSNIPNSAFYKDVFLDAGIGLTSRKRLPALTHLGLSVEGMSFSSDEDIELQNQLIEGEPIDLNGRLLYPDGQPRYRLLFVNGGGAYTHGQSLSDASRQNMRLFNQNGGSYVGTCAGSSFASQGFDGPSFNQYYLHIWPDFVKRTDLMQSYTGFFIEPNSPLLDYFDFGGDLYVDSVRHNNGNYPSSMPIGGEVLARYDYPAYPWMNMQPSAWAYKASSNAGRVVQIGSHPEEVNSGERRDFTEAAVLYALDGRGTTVVKGALQNGIRRNMTKSSLDNDPGHAMIGDLQCHHFVVLIPKGAVNVSFTLQSESDADLSLMLRKDGFAYEEQAQYVSNGSGANKQLVFSKLDPGLWYVAVKCNTTVTTTETDWGQEYSGRTDVLNGIPYSIRGGWATTTEASIVN